MFIIKIMGGFGNQMFQYAFTRALSIHFGCDFKLDLSQLKQDGLRKLGLNVFELDFNIAEDSEIKALKIKTKVPKFLRKIFNVEKFDPKTYFLEKEFLYHQEVFEKIPPFYFEGFWQSEKYFKNIEKIIRNDFAFKNLDFLKNTKLLKQIQDTNSVSLHIRRGDYIKDTKNKAIYDVLTIEYYQRAVEYMKNNLEKPVFYVFSDDLNWVKENLEIENAFYSKGENHFEDFYLMQNCKHNIIANSSFSWWAAWLNNNLQKIVIAPDKWFSDSSEISYADVIPENWIKINVS